MKIKMDNVFKGLKCSFFGFILMFCVSMVYGQSVVTGVVSDASNNEPLPGVNVVVVGTTSGTFTDREGRYSVRVSDSNGQLRFSFTGYKSQTIDVSGRSVVNVSMEIDLAKLNELVVIGYGTIEKKDATGSLLTLKADDFNQGSTISPEQLFTGKFAGVNVTAASGEPGASFSINVRGRSSIRAGNQPLIVIDGFPLDGTNVTPGASDGGFGGTTPRNPLNFINPNDIASIDVLKGPSATAVYGSRGANGVIFITTKSGSRGSSNITYSASASISNISKKMDLLSAADYVDAAIKVGAVSESINFGDATDWQDEIYRDAYSMNHNISIATTTDQGNYYFSLAYQDEQGLVKETSLEKYTARLRSQQVFLDDMLSFKLNLSASRLLDQYAPIGNNVGFEGDLISAALQANPTRPITTGTDDNGDPIYNQANEWRNPVAMLAYSQDQAETMRVLANIEGVVNFSNALKLTVNTGIDFANSERKSAYSAKLAGTGYASITDKGRAAIDNRNVRTSLFEMFLNYKESIASDINLDLLLGYSYQEYYNSGNFIQCTNFASDLIRLWNQLESCEANNSGARQIDLSSYEGVSEIQSGFMRANVDINDKYLFTASLRYDGSSKFGVDNKYGLFPSFAVAWRASEEESFRESLEELNVSELKLRAEWGITGNQGFDGGISQTSYNIGRGGSISIVAIPNPDLKWESTSQLNFGMDVGIWDGRLTGSVDYFYKSTSDLITLLSVPQPAPYSLAWTNLDADVINQGLEVSLNVTTISTRDMNWVANINFATLSNVVKNLENTYNTGQIHGQGLTGAYAQRIANDQPLSAFYMQQYDGLDENGKIKYVNDGERVFVGSPTPNFIVGFSTVFNYKDFDVSVSFRGAFGHYIYNNTANALFTTGSLRNARNITVAAANSGINADDTPSVSTLYLESGDFLRLDNISLGYNFRMPTNTPLTSIKLSLTAQNLFVFTSYSGYDPEVNTDKNIDGIPSASIDYTSYPKARSLALGLSVNF